MPAARRRPCRPARHYYCARRINLQFRSHRSFRGRHYRIVTTGTGTGFLPRASPRGACTSRRRRRRRRKGENKQLTRYASRVQQRIITSCRIIYPCVRYAGETNIFCLMSRTENGFDTRADEKKKCNTNNNKIRVCTRRRYVSLTSLMFFPFYFVSCLTFPFFPYFFFYYFLNTRLKPYAYTLCTYTVGPKWAETRFSLNCFYYSLFIFYFLVHVFYYNTSLHNVWMFNTLLLSFQKTVSAAHAAAHTGLYT